ncbi:hypothetical protein [Campylobacter canadensis]|nr:hypothetical protein [Campylobacter canadensis]
MDFLTSLENIKEQIKDDKEKEEQRKIMQKQKNLEDEFANFINNN